MLHVTRQYGTPPVFLGPVLVHHCLIFASSLVRLRRSHEGSRIFGKDGEAPVIDAFGHESIFVIHLYCFNHMCSNVKIELQGQEYPTGPEGAQHSRQ